MDSLIKSAVNGQRKAMETLYNASKQRVYQVAYSLLKDEDAANDATVAAFKSVFSNIKNHSVETQKDFTDIAVVKAADNCKKVILKKNSKAYQFPVGKNFSIKNPKSASDISENYAEFVFGQFTELQQLIFVLHTVGELNSKRIAAVTKLDVKTVEIALNAEKENVESIVGGALTYEAICESFIRSEKDSTVSVKTNADVKKIISEISAPIEKARKIRITAIIAAVLAACLLIGGGVWLFTGNDSEESSQANDVSGPQLSIDMNKTYYADIDIKDYGKITVKLDQKQAPITVDNFVKLSKSGFYDGLTFHRIIEGFMMQGGDPDGNGTGGNIDKNGNKVVIKGEFSANGVNNTISHTRGVISMARASYPYDSASSQFFIVHEDSLFLDGQYAGFGYVTEGMDIVDKICTEINGEPVPKDKQPIINKITIREE